MNDTLDKAPNAPPDLKLTRPSEDTLLVSLNGTWKLGDGTPSADELLGQVHSDPRIQRVVLDTRGLTGWDSSLVTFLRKVMGECSGAHIRLQSQGLPNGVQRLLSLASAVPEKKGARKEVKREPLLSRIGEGALEAGRSGADALGFIGESFLGFVSLIRGKAQFRRSDLMLILQECGVQALPIVSLISFLVGLILAFVGAIQLMMFGAQIYIADLVGIAMAREMGAIMTGIIMAGRTGAAFAAQLGTMQVNEEIDALTTMGLSPMEFLVVPRMLALALMMPLLCLYADLMGIVGGLVVGVGMLDLTLPQYIEQTRGAVNLTHLSVGVGKSVVFGVLVAVSGCMRGMECGRSASAVGMAATSAVVTAIVAIIASDGLFAVITTALGI